MLTVKKNNQRKFQDSLSRPFLALPQSAPNPQIFFGRDETVQHPHKEFGHFISIWYF